MGVARHHTGELQILNHLRGWSWMVWSCRRWTSAISTCACSKHLVRWWNTRMKPTSGPIYLSIIDIVSYLWNISLGYGKSPAARAPKIRLYLKRRQIKKRNKTKRRAYFDYYWNYLSVLCSILRWIVRNECLKKAENELLLPPCALGQQNPNEEFKIV